MPNVRVDDEIYKSVREEQLDALYAYADALKNNSQYTKAINLLKKVMQTHQNFTMEQISRKVELLSIEVQKFARNDDQKRAEEKTKLITILHKMASQKKNEIQVKAMHMIVQSLMFQRKFSEAEENLVKICDFYDSIWKRDSKPSTKLILDHSMAMLNREICRKFRDRDTAETNINKILSEEKIKAEPSMPIIVISTLHLAEFKMDLGYYEEAKTMLTNVEAKASARDIQAVKQRIAQCESEIAKKSGKGDHDLKRQKVAKTSEA